MERIDVLREHNKSLLKQLKLQRETLRGLGGRKREREDGSEKESSPGETVTLPGRDPAGARAALTKPSVKYTDIGEKQPDIQSTVAAPSLTSKHSEGSAENLTVPDLFTGSYKPHQDHNTLVTTTKSCLVDRSKERSDLPSRVTFQPDEYEDVSASESHRLPPLLGYDWIAGVLDADDSVMERSDDFFNDLRVFRSLNKDECVHSAQAQFSDKNHSGLPVLSDKDSPKANRDTHQCTFSYRMNSRLFPVPLHAQECCPVCKRHKSSHPHSAADPALVRVSIPLTNLLPPYKYKAHRRCSFDPSDCLGLPSHCLSGWSNTGQATLPPPSSLDLKSSLNKNTKDLEDLCGPKLFGNHEQISEISRLARHNFQHFSPKRKLGSRSRPV